MKQEKGCRTRRERKERANHPGRAREGVAVKVVFTNIDGRAFLIEQGRLIIWPGNLTPVEHTDEGFLASAVFVSFSLLRTRMPHDTIIAE